MKNIALRATSVVALLTGIAFSQTSLPLTGQAGAVIANPGSYKLTKSVTMVEITASNVTLDLNGFTVANYLKLTSTNCIVKNGIVKSVDANEAALYVGTGSKNVAVTGLAIDGKGVGIKVLSAENVVVTDVKIVTPTGYAGIWEMSSKGVVIENTSVSAPQNSYSAGISLEGEGNVVRNCYITGHYYGIGDASTGRYNTIVGTTFYNVARPMSNSLNISSGNTFLKYTTNIYSPNSPNTNAAQN